MLMQQGFKPIDYVQLRIKMVLVTLTFCRLQWKKCKKLAD
jgi:hypothetical protein